MSGRIFAGGCVVVLVTLLSASGLAAGPLVTGRAFDGEASSKALLGAYRQGKNAAPELKVPLAERELTLELLAPAADGSLGAGKSWKVPTGPAGEFRLDTALGQWPDGSLLVARGELGGQKAYSPFLRLAEGPQDVHLYPSTDSPSEVTASLKVAYDVEKAGETRSIRVRAQLSFVNRGGTLYIGKKAGAPQREVWRLPLPADASIVLNKGPAAGIPAWRVSEDKRWLVLDTPIPGLCDVERQGPWEVHYLLRPRQSLVQYFTVPLETQPLAVFCLHEEMALKSSELSRSTRLNEDPLTGEPLAFDVVFPAEPIKPGQSATVVLGVDNVAIAQKISLNAVKWVGGFILASLLALLAGFVVGPSGPRPELLLDSLSGDEVLDRIADLDRRFARGEIREKDYKLLREPLVSLAAEELAAHEPDTPGPAAASAPLVQEILERLEELERRESRDSSLLGEKVRLLEELWKTLRRKGSGP